MRISKKLATVIIAIVLIIANKYIGFLDGASVAALTGMVIAYLISQGIADTAK